MIGLADCNSFYCSCERVFDPKLLNRPIIVMSNNDGCVVSRCPSAKAIGIPMGVPAFQIKKLIEEYNVAVFSSNYTLYGSMSNRVMTTLSKFAAEVEIYSIDEAFLDFTGFDKYDLKAYGREIVTTTKMHTGIPISLGIAPTKALSKVANKMAKKDVSNHGVLVLEDPEQITAALKAFPVEEVWGIGRQYTKMLHAHKIKTAFDLTQASAEWVKKKMSIVGLRLQEELQGKARFSMELEPPAKKNICTSRSFGKMLTDYEPIEEAVANFAASCAAKLRRQKTCAGVITVFLHTNHFRPELPQYSKTVPVKLQVATNSSIELIRYATGALKAIFKKGYSYKKAGVIVSDIVPENQVQKHLFDRLTEEERAKHHKLMDVMDKLNSVYGRDVVRIAKQGYDRSWKLRQEKLSRCYTTRLSDIIVVNV